MSELSIIENFGTKFNDEVFATRNQIKQLFDAPVKTLADNINQLKEDGIINGAKIRLLAKDGKKRLMEAFTIQETIKIGFRLRSERALQLQDYASKLMVSKIQELTTKNKILEDENKILAHENAVYWNRDEIDQMYPR